MLLASTRRQGTGSRWRRAIRAAIGPKREGALARRTGGGERRPAFEVLRPRAQSGVVAPTQFRQAEFQPEERASAGDVAERHAPRAGRGLGGEGLRERRDAGVHLVGLARDPRRVLARRFAFALEEDRDAAVGNTVAQRVVAAHSPAFVQRRGNEV